MLIRIIATLLTVIGRRLRCATCPFYFLTLNYDHWHC